MDIKEITVYPVSWPDNGGSSPYGYYQIRKVYADGSSWVVAFLDNKTSESAVTMLATQLAIDFETKVTFKDTYGENS